jgi:4-amino-4-deoxy-L-arabinose transferase-like glycosyltransferase
VALSSSPERETVPVERAPTRLAALRSFAPVGVVLVLALALRLWGITWALPNQDRYFTYHPDEGVNLVSGVIDPTTGTARPHLDLRFYNYGSLYFYLWQGAVAANRAYGAISLPDIDHPSGSPASIASMILMGRCVTVLFGVLTVWALFGLGNRLFGRSTGLLAAFIWAILPVAVVHGHYATVDVTATFFVTMALLCAARALEDDPRSVGEEYDDGAVPTVGRRGSSQPMRLLLLSAVFAGLAAATKYNCGIVLFAPLAAALLRKGPGASPGLWAVPAIAAVAVAAFLLGCPGILINPELFWKHFSYELAKSQEGMGLLFAETGNGWWYHLVSSLRFGFGVPLLLMSVGGLFAALVRRSRQDVLLLAFFVPYYLVIGYAQVRYVRYILPITPVLAVFAAGCLMRPAKSPVANFGVKTLGWAAVAFTLLLTLALDSMFVRPDTRDQAKEYLDSLPGGSSVAFVWTPWFHSPPLSPGFTLPDPRRRMDAASNYTGKSLRLPHAGEWDQNLLREPLPNAFAVSEYETGDATRIGWGPAKPFFKLWRERYSPVQFVKTASIFGIDFGKPAYTPNDWLYLNPTTTVYTLNRSTP